MPGCNWMTISKGYRKCWGLCNIHRM